MFNKCNDIDYDIDFEFKKKGNYHHCISDTIFTHLWKVMYPKIDINLVEYDLLTSKM